MPCVIGGMDQRVIEIHEDGLRIRHDSFHEARITSGSAQKSLGTRKPCELTDAWESERRQWAVLLSEGELPYEFRKSKLEKMRASAFPIAFRQSSMVRML